MKYLRFLECDCAYKACFLKLMQEELFRNWCRYLVGESTVPWDSCTLGQKPSWRLLLFVCCTTTINKTSLHTNASTFLRDRIQFITNV